MFPTLASETPADSSAALLTMAEANGGLKTAQAAAAPAACAATKLDIASVVASAQDDNLAVNVLDGNLATRWSGSGIGTYITADLGSRKQVCRVVLAWYRGNERTNQFALSVSNDGVNFSPLYSGSSAQNLALQTYTVTPTTARYVRLTVNGNTQNDWASVTELQVHGGAAGFNHPGVLVSRSQLEFVKAKVAAGVEPWAGQVNVAKRSRYGQLTYRASPVAVMKCGTSGAAADPECFAAREDALAAYTQALIWYYTGDQRYANNAIAILNAWSSKFQKLVFDMDKISTDPSQNNGPLQAAWLSELFPRSAEILKHMGSGWAPAESQRFTNMMTTVLLPHIYNGWSRGSNWQLSMASGVMNIGVLSDNRATFDQGVTLWRQTVPWNMYMRSDGAIPKAPPAFNTHDKIIAYWFNQTTFVDGITQETCRDLSHTAMGHASTAQAAETARIQGVDLYGEQQARIVAAHEFVANKLNKYPPPPYKQRDPKPVEAWLCNGLVKIEHMPTWEIAYNHYHGRKGVAMPETAKLIANNRKYITPYNVIQMSWEELTHSGTAQLP
jgi:hypothetical protein